jgi:hypothetical protein
VIRLRNKARVQVLQLSMQRHIRRAARQTTRQCHVKPKVVEDKWVAKLVKVLPLPFA